MKRPLTVGQLAHATGVPAKTIRYYEQGGVLPVPRRSPAGYRQYAPRDVHRLSFVRRARALGLSLKDLTMLTAELDNGLCGTMRPRLSHLVQDQLQTVQQRIAEFQLLQRQLEQVLHQMLAAPPSDPAEGCQCLDLDTAPPREGLPHSCTSTLGEEPMDTQKTFEAFTTVSTTSGCGDGCCGCGCELPLTQLSHPQETEGHLKDDVLVLRIGTFRCTAYCHHQEYEECYDPCGGEEQPLTSAQLRGWDTRTMGPRHTMY